jgi:tRNA-specific 2-thiouridylase
VISPVTPSRHDNLHQAHGALVIVGLSGGVDSSVAALRLLEAGYRVEGLFMFNWEDPESDCDAPQDFQDARSVC